jgi:DnaK suppressor protein
MAKTTRSSTAAKAQKRKPLAAAHIVKIGKSKVVASKGRPVKSATKTPTKAARTAAKPVAKPVAKAAVKKVLLKRTAVTAVKKPVAKKPAAKATARKAVAKSPPKKVSVASKPVARKVAVKKTAVKKSLPKIASGKGASLKHSATKKVMASKPTAKHTVKKVTLAVKPTGQPVTKPISKPTKPVKSVKPASSKHAAGHTTPAKPVPKPAGKTVPVATIKTAIPASVTALYKGKVASATAMVMPRPAPAAHHASSPKSHKNLSSSMNKLATEKLDSGATREDGRYALPSTSVVTLPKGYRPSSKEEYMSPLQLAYFRNKLRDWRDQLVDESRQTMDNLRDEVRDVGDEAERATRETENSLELRTRDRYRKLISKIDKALRRIEDGSYGFCEETDEDIGVERLDARPIATLSLDAQERREHLQKQMGD